MKNLLATIVISALMAAPVLSLNNRIDEQRPDAPELAAQGALGIGVRTLHLIHKNQLDVLNIKAGQDTPRYDRPLTAEVWYPATTQQRGGEYTNVFLRDGKTTVSLHGRAIRDAPPLAGSALYPLIILSHGYPGNRYLMSHFGENLASKGYVVVAVDHTDSTYRDAAAISSTLLNRALDQKFLLDEFARFNDTPDHFLHNTVDATNAGLIGYSMGGYGAVISAGGGVSQLVAENPESSPNGVLDQVAAGSAAFQSLVDDRFKAIVAIAPWGRQNGFWDAKGLQAVRTPMFFISGSQDNTSGYEKGTRALFQQVSNVDRYLLTYNSGGHSSAAPIPAPAETVNAFYPDGSSVFIHYADPVWDPVRGNNIAQHFVTAYFSLLLKDNTAMEPYLKMDDTGDYTQWQGFPGESAPGIRLEFLGRAQ